MQGGGLGGACRRRGGGGGGGGEPALRPKLLEIIIEIRFRMPGVVDISRLPMGPVRRIAPSGPHVQVHIRAGREHDLSSVDGELLRGLRLVDHQRRGRHEPELLGHDCADRAVWELGEVVLVGPGFGRAGAEGGVEGGLEKVLGGVAGLGRGGRSVGRGRWFRGRRRGG